MTCKQCVFIFAFLLSLFSSAQETLKIMQYNLLNYGNTTTSCTTSNNSITAKNTYLKTIINYVQPDVFTVVEISQDTSKINGLMRNVLNTSGRTYYQHADRTNYSSSDIVNMLYYDSRKLVHKKTIGLAGGTRDINIYTMYHNGPELANGDTVWLNFIVAHLKAGSYADEAVIRAAETTILMNYLNAINPNGNYMVMGDFNLYTSSEVAYQNLTAHANSNIRFYDPINRPGNWNNSGEFDDIHTQSTHTAANGCASPGGMDDRFDFILANMNILTGQKGAKYISGTYKALAQDGNHFNSAINASPTNTLVPDSVLQALYNNSDHLPIRMDILIDHTLKIEESQETSYSCEVLSFDQNLLLRIHSGYETTYSIQIHDIHGRLILQTQELVPSGSSIITISVPQVNKGIYLLNIQAGKERPYAIKVAKF